MDLKDKNGNYVYPNPCDIDADNVALISNPGFEYSYADRSTVLYPIETLYEDISSGNPVTEKTFFAWIENLPRA